MSRVSICLLASLTLLTLLPEAPAVAEPLSRPPASMFKPQPRREQPSGELKPARNLENMPASLTIRVGEKRSFKKSGQAAAMNPDMLKTQVNENSILTVVGLKPGNTQIFMFGATTKKAPTSQDMKTPKKIPVKITAY